MPGATRLRSLFGTPLEQSIVAWWAGIDPAAKKAFFAAIVVSVLAFGFEMTNLTLNHDDVWHIFIEDNIINWYMGRFSFGWLHVLTQNHYFMPFLQMAEGIVLMSVYGVYIARFWGLRQVTDIALVAIVVCVFPYMAQTYQYNTSMAIYPLAHLLAALAVGVSTRARLGSVVLAAVLYVAAFSIYQSVAANAATIFVIWLLARVLFNDSGDPFGWRAAVRPTVAVAVAAIAGGLLYLAIVSLMNIPFDATQGTDEAFKLGDATKFSVAIPAVVNGTKAFFIWPERYFPDYLKVLQAFFLGATALYCLWRPNRLGAKVAALMLLVLACLTPRVLQLLHPDARYHSLTLTAYAVLVAGTVMVTLRARWILMRNGSIILASVLIGGYVLQCNWISTVNYLNTLAHFETVTQVLARLRSMPDTSWDGKSIVVVGSYDTMPSEYPFRPADSVASKYLDAMHMTALAGLMRDEAKFVAADKTMPKVLEFAVTHPTWPHPGSVGVVDGKGVVVFAKAPKLDR